MDEIHKIVLDVVFKCERRDVSVSESLAAFVARLTIIQNPDRFKMDRQLMQDDVRELIRLCVERLTEKDSPRLETLKMQVAFDGAFAGQKETMVKQRDEHSKMISLLERDLANMKVESAKDVASFDSMFREMVRISCLRARQDPNNEVVQREASAALESVLPKTNLMTFAKLPFGEKRDRLQDLSNYVLGIRLFNMFLGRGGSGLGVAPQEAWDSFSELAVQVDGTVDEIQKQCAGYMSVLRAIEAGAVVGRAERLQEELVERRQLLSYYRSLQDEMREASDECREVLARFNEEASDLRNLVQSSAAVPKEDVYPVFEALAGAWTDGRGLLDHANALHSLLNSVSEYELPNYESRLRQELVDKALAWEQEDGNDEEQQQVDLKRSQEEEAAAVEASKQASGADTGESSEGDAQPSENAVVEPPSDEPVRVFKDAHPFVLSRPVEFSGYCPVTLHDRDGMLLPGNPGLGYVLYKSRLYSLSSMAAVDAFVENASQYVQGVLDCARKHPALITFLSLHETFSDVTLKKVAAGLFVKAEKFLGDTKEIEIQTEMHVQESNIDRSYEWNEWSLRRRALQLTDLRYRRTHSTQTHSSHFRRENVSQTYPAKDNSSQTRVDSGTNPPKHIRYVSGLRGRPSEVVRDVHSQLELPHS